MKGSDLGSLVSLRFIMVVHLSSTDATARLASCWCFCFEFDLSWHAVWRAIHNSMVNQWINQRKKCSKEHGKAKAALIYVLSYGNSVKPPHRVSTSSSQQSNDRMEDLVDSSFSDIYLNDIN